MEGPDDPAGPPSPAHGRTPDRPRPAVGNVPAGLDAPAVGDRARAARARLAAHPAAPFAVAALLLVAGYLRYAPGVAYSQSPAAYRDWAFPAFRYSDLIWLYLRDGLADRPVPYLDYPLEYPVLTGLLSYLLALAPGLGAAYALTSATLALCALATVWALVRLPGARASRYESSPVRTGYSNG